MIGRRDILKGTAAMVSYRPAGDSRGTVAGQGGVQPRRPDQRQAGLSQAGSGPAPQQGIFLGKFVIIFGSAGGLFIYNGKPAPGNPPIFALTTASTDPYTNTVNPSAATDVGVPFYFYEGSAAAGNLICSVANAAGTDDFGNAALPGVTIYGTTGGVTYAAGLAWSGGGPGAGIPVLRFYTATSEAGPWTNQGNIQGDSLGDLLIAAASGASITTTAKYFTASPIAVPAISAPSGFASAATLYAASGGALQIIDNADGNTYDSERLTLAVTSDVPIASTSPVTITGLSAALAVRSYRISGVLYVVQGGTAGQQAFTFPFTGTSGGGASRIGAFMSIEGASTENVDLQNVTSFSGTITQPAYAAGSTVHILLDGVMVVTGSGTLTLKCANVTGSDTCTVKAGSFIDLMPVVA